MNAASSMAETSQLLTFMLEDEVFALDISKVREVLDFTAVTKVPQSPDFMLGVINLRGSVVPVVDMRVKFGMTRRETTVNTCIIIVEIDIDGESTVLGALADSVQEVVGLELDQARSDRAPSPNRHTPENQIHQGHGETGESVHHHPGYR